MNWTEWLLSHLGWLVAGLVVRCLKLHCLGSYIWLAVFRSSKSSGNRFLTICFVLLFFQDASSADIRKAYRKLSLILHPDKNKDENAEIQFRQVSVMCGNKTFRGKLEFLCWCCFSKNSGTPLKLVS